MERKTQQIQRLVTYLLAKYGSSHIDVVDYWDGDNTAIGLADKAKQYTVYIHDYGRRDNRFFVALESPSTDSNAPYAPSGDFENLSAEEVEGILIRHLHIA